MKEAIFNYYNAIEKFHQIKTAAGDILWDSRHSTERPTQAFNRLLQEGYVPVQPVESVQANAETWSLFYAE